MVIDNSDFTRTNKNDGLIMTDIIICVAPVLLPLFIFYFLGIFTSSFSADGNGANCALGAKYSVLPATVAVVAVDGFRLGNCTRLIGGGIITSGKVDGGRIA